MKLNTHLLYISLIFISVNTFCSLLCIVHIVKSMKRTGIRRKRTTRENNERPDYLQSSSFTWWSQFHSISFPDSLVAAAASAADVPYSIGMMQGAENKSILHSNAFCSLDGYNYWVEHCTATQQQLPQNISIKLGYSQWKFAMAQKLHHFVSKD